MCAFGECVVGVRVPSVSVLSVCVCSVSVLSVCVPSVCVRSVGMFGVCVRWVCSVGMFGGCSEAAGPAAGRGRGPRSQRRCPSEFRAVGGGFFLSVLWFLFFVQRDARVSFSQRERHATPRVGDRRAGRS